MKDTSDINYFLQNCRTDLAIEMQERFCESGENTGVKVEYSQVNKLEIFVNNVKVLTDEASENIGKPVGNYITIECEDMKGPDREIHDTIIQILTEKIQELVSIEKDDKVLIVGLGNEFVTPDAIGPKVVSKAIVTGHLYDMWEEDMQSVFSRVYAISPGVMGQTGVETVDIVKGVVDKIKPKVVIVVDALASRRIERVNSTIQISDTGITPGAGIGNNRKGLNEETLGVKVIAVGVPTVISTTTLISDSIDYIIEELAKSTSEDEKLSSMLKISDERKYNIINDILQPYTANMFVTPKEIDQVVERLSNIIANAINLSINGGLTKEDINDFMI